MLGGVLELNGRMTVTGYISYDANGGTTASHWGGPTLASLSGPFNAVAPEPVRQHDFARALGRVLHRPSFAPAPAFALHALLGRAMADQMLLASQKLTPSVLVRKAHAYRDPQLEPALAALLGRVHGGGA